MSVVHANGTKVVLPRSGPDEFWRTIHEHFAGDDALMWKYLAMLALRENAGWPLEQIGRAFDHPKGHVTRCLTRIKGELKQRFEACPEFAGLNGDQTPKADSGFSDPRRPKPRRPKPRNRQPR